MSVKNWLGDFFGSKPTPVAPKPQRKAKVKDKKTVKELANENNEPYFEIIEFNFDPEDPTEGSFELDWNQVFVNDLRKAGYPGKEDHEVIDNYFTHICRHIVMETFQKDEAINPEPLVKKKDIGDGRSEYS